MAHRREGQVKPWVTRADLLTALRLPLAAAFPFVHQPMRQLALVGAAAASDFFDGMLARRFGGSRAGDRKSTRLNSSHSQNSYAVFCLKKKKISQERVASDAL